MKVGIIGRKVGMTRIFEEGGIAVPITVVDVTDCRIAQVKLKETDGYAALQVAHGERKPQNLNKALSGHYKKAGFAGKAKLKEIRVGSDEEITHLKPGKKLSVKMFSKGDKIDVTATSKGHGFSGVMKRHNMHGGKASHGVHEYYRHGGSIGATTSPGRVLKNVGMPGQHGNTRKTVQNLEIADVDSKKSLLLIKGAVPGAKNGLILIQSATKMPPKKDASWA